MNAMERPGAGEVPAFYQRYIDQADGRDLIEALMNASEVLWAVVRKLPAGRKDHAYAPGKWTVGQLLQHINDAERVFAYRALRFARRDATPLAGYDEDAWADATAGSARSIDQLMAEHDALRAASIALFQGCSANDLLATGTGNGNTFTVRALGWAIAGHAVHHANVLHERYL
jgi:uncharacterized damage-inducible protein DinB